MYIYIYKCIYVCIRFIRANKFIFEYIVLRYFIWLYQIDGGLESVKADIFYELIFRQLSALLLVLTIMMPRQSRRSLMIIYLYCADICNSVSKREWLLPAKISRLLSFEASVLFHNNKKKKEKEKRKWEIKFFCSHNFILQSTKVIFCASLSLALKVY